MNYSFNHLSLIQSIFICLFHSFLYIISLYVWSHENRYNRHSPKVIKRRFLSVLSTSIICVVIVYLIAKQSDDINGYSFYKWIGIRFDSTFLAVTLLPLLLTMILFAGPILQSFLAQTMSISNLFDFYYLNDIIWWRNLIVSPFTEEFVFRSCMIPLLVHNLGMKLTIFLSPLSFGLAHLHHIIESIYLLKSNGQRSDADFNRQNIKTIIVPHLFQFSYTYIFGLYSSFLFLRCANLIPCFLCHSFCNFMGFPNIGEVLFSENFSDLQRKLIIIAYVVGLILFICLIGPFTEPSLFDNQIYLNY